MEGPLSLKKEIPNTNAWQLEAVPKGAKPTWWVSIDHQALPKLGS